jgi:membrane associated rhomboid family serine protease
LLVLHMFAHGGLLHVAMNAASLLVLSAPLIKHLGRPPISLARYLYLFVGSGISGAVLFLAINADDYSSMLGASGGIFGILGALVRVNPITGTAVAIRSRRTWLLAKLIMREQAALLFLFVLIAFVTGASVSMAWEAHLGGFLFGLLASPIFLQRNVEQ